MLTAALACSPVALGDAPFYSSESVVNSADSQSGPLAPNAFGTVYGKGLSYVTRALAPDDVRGGMLPTVLPGTGVTVLVGGLGATIYYVSPTQINFVVPCILRPGRTDFQVVMNGIAGPVVAVDLAPSSPAIFQLDAQTVIATRLDGSLITWDAPAHARDIIVLYATGLGETLPPAIYRMVANAAAPLKQLADLKVLLDGVAVDSSLVLYAGIAPGFAGLYQINLRLPDTAGANPQIQIGMPDALSPSGLKLPLNP